MPRAIGALWFCVSLLGASGARSAELVPAPIVQQQIEQALGTPPVAELGALGQKLARELVDGLCASAEVRELLPRFCAPGPIVLEQVKARLLLDLMAAPQRYLALARLQISPEQRLALALLAQIGADPNPLRWAQELASALDCPLDEQARALAPLPWALGGAPPEQQACAALRLALEVLELVLEPSSAGVTRELDRVSGGALSEGQAELRRQRAEIERRARELQQRLLEQLQRRLAALDPTASLPRLTPAQQALLLQLLERALWVERQWRRWQAAKDDPLALALLLASELGLVEAALGVIREQSSGLPPELLPLAQALLAGDSEKALELLQTWLVERSQLPERVMTAAHSVLRFADVRSVDEARRVVQAALLGLGPWSEGVLFNANLGVPKLEDDRLNLVGAALLGYDAGAWGLAVRGNISVFDLSGSSVDSSTLHGGGRAEGWFAFDLDAQTRLEARGSFETTLFDTDSSWFDAARNPTLFAEELSVLFRGEALAGLRHRTPRLAFGVWIGGGVQVESYSATGVEFGVGEVQVDDDDSAALMAEARLRAEWILLPEALALRGRAEAEYHQLTRLVSTASVGAMTEFVATDSRTRELDASGELYLDLELARLFQFVPGVGVGLDYHLQRIEGAPSVSTLVPIVSLSVRRVAF